jgi:YtfJ family uncharacterized protein
MKSNRRSLPTLFVSVVVFCFSPVFAFDHADLKPGKTLPVLDIHEGGEISVTSDNILKQPWSSRSFENKGKVQVIQYVAASRKAFKQNKPFNQTLMEKQYSSDQLDTTIIVHMADTVAFAHGIVVKKLADKKIEHKAVNFIVDNHGVGLERWGMKHKSFAIIVLDANGKVLFVKDGPLSEFELESAIELIERHMT